MPWLQLTVTVSKDDATAAEEVLQALGAMSITYGDGAEQPLLEPAPGELPLWDRLRVTALFEGRSDPQRLRHALARQLPEETLATLETESLPDQVWERAWLADFRPMQFGRRLWVCPAGNRPEAPAAVVVDLEPGLAFGTGTHPTTALCLKWLDGAALEGRQVLDYGCGSGILAVAAARLGAARVLAVDHDPQALQATAANAAKNRVADRVLPVHPTELPDTAFDVVLANILAGTLMQLAPLLGARTVNGGELVLAGILEHQADEVAAAYREMFELGRPHQSQEWVLLHGYRRGR